MMLERLAMDKFQVHHPTPWEFRSRGQTCG